MDNLSNNSLYKKYGLLLGILTSVFGIIILTALSNAVILSAALIGIEVKSYTKFILGIIIRIIAMVFLLTFARNLEIVNLMGFGFKNFGKAICYSFIGYAFALGFLIDVVTVNLALNNELDFVSMFWCFAFCLMIGLFEETLSRGITMTLIKGTIENKFFVIIIQALIFMLLHLANFFSGALELRAQVTQLIIAFVAGVYYGFVYEKTGSLFGAVLLHAVYDFGVSSPEIFRPTGEYGIVYSDVGFSVLVFAGLFVMLFLAIGLLVRSIKEMTYYKENYEENYE